MGGLSNWTIFCWSHTGRLFWPYHARDENGYHTQGLPPYSCVSCSADLGVMENRNTYIETTWNTTIFSPTGLLHDYCQRPPSISTSQQNENILWEHSGVEGMCGAIMNSPPPPPPHFECFILRRGHATFKLN